MRDEFKRPKPICLLVIDGFHVDFLLNENLPNIKKLQEQFPVLFLKSNDKNIENPWNSYMEIGTGLAEFDASYKTTDVSLAKSISIAGLRQLHIAETENFANLTYFFNGQDRSQNEKEDWEQINSPKMDDYLSRSEMMTSRITSRIIKEIEKKDYDVIFANYSNLLINSEDKSKALKIIDSNLKRLIDNILAYNGALIVTSNTSFVKNNNIVPFFLISKKWKNKSFANYDYSQKINHQIPSGWISDIAPTILKIIGISKPQQMSDNSFI